MSSRTAAFLIAAALFFPVSGAYAQQMQGGMSGAGTAVSQDAKMAMMQEPNKALAQASVLYMTVFTKSLHVQSTERRDKIDSKYIKAAFAEMKRAYGMIEAFQAAHVKTMDDAMKENVKMMMMKMNTSLEDIQNELETLEKEVNGKQDLNIIASRSEAMLKQLDDMPKPRMSSGEMPAGKPMKQ
jgi:hypothetical protein